MDYTVGLLPLAMHHEEAGQLKLFKMKCMTYEDNVVCWDLRRVASKIFVHRKKLDLRKLMNRDLLPWMTAITTFGFDVMEEVFPSRRCALNADPNAVHPKVRSTYTCTTFAMFYLLVFLVNERRHKEEQEIARDIVCSWIRSVVPASAIEDFWEDCQFIPEDESNKCQVGLLDGRCEHFREAFRVVEWETSRVHAQLIERFCHLVTFASCPALSSMWMGHVLKAFSKIMDRAVGQMKLESDMLLDDSPVRGAKRKLPLDEDLKESARQAVADGKISHTAALARFSQKFDRQSAADMDQQHLVQYQAECWLMGKRGGDITVAPDATRCGNPAEESMQLPCWLDSHKTAVVLPCQVIRDYKRCAEKPEKKKTLASKLKNKQEVESFMCNESNTLGKDAAVNKISNVICIKALDHAVQGGIDRALPEFICDEQLKPLQAHEERYPILNEDLEPEHRREGCVRRAGVLNKSTKSRRYELPVEILDQDSMFIFSDQGSVGWVAWIYLFIKLGFMGFFHWDVCHHWWNELCNGMKAAGNWFFISELTVLLNLCSGPCSGSAWFHTIAHGLKQYCSLADYTDPLFQFFYIRIAEDMDDDSPSDIGTVEHMKKIFNKIATARVFKNKNMMVKKARWMSVWDSLELFLPFWSCYALALTWVCAKYNIISGISGLVHHDFAPLIINGEFVSKPPLPDAAHANKEVRHSNKEADDLRKKARNTLHLGCMIATNRFKRNLAAGLLKIVEPIRVTFGMMILMLSTQRGSVEFWSVYAAGQKHDEELAAILNTLVDQSMYRSVRYASAEVYANPAGPEAIEDAKLGQQLWKSVLSVVAYRLLGHLNMMWSLPTKTAALLHADPAIVAETLKLLDAWFELLMKLERRALTDRFVAGLLKDLYWPDLQWVRMIMVGLWEAGFLEVPPWVCRKLLSVWKSLTFTKPTEDLNRVLRNKEKNWIKSNDLGRIRRWHSLVESKVLQENDRGRVFITQAAKCAAASCTISPQLFDPESDSCNLSDSQLASMSQNFTTLAPAVSNVTVLSWMALTIIGDKPAVLKRMWHALLCTVGTVIRNQKKSQQGIVMYVSVFGVLCLKVKPQRVAGRVILSCHYGKEQCWQFLTITEYWDWTVLDIGFKTPGASAFLFESIEGCDANVGAFLETVGEAKPLVLHSSQNCFLGVTVPHLAKLWPTLEIPTPKEGKPTTEKKLCDLMVRHLNPVMPETNVQAILDKRFKPQVNEISTLLAEEGNKELVEEVLGERHFATVNAEVDKLVEKILALEKGSAPPPSGPSAASSGSAASSSSAKPADPDAAPGVGLKKRFPPATPGVSDYDFEEVKSLLPQVPGCNATVEMKWHSRWRCTYPGVDTGVSKSFGHACDEQEAIHIILTWAWKQHEKAGGESCPFLYNWHEYI